MGVRGRLRPCRAGQQPFPDGVASALRPFCRVPRGRPRRLVLARRGERVHSGEPAADPEPAHGSAGATAERWNVTSHPMTMRLFVAIPLAAAVVDELTRVTARLRSKDD